MLLISKLSTREEEPISKILSVIFGWNETCRLAALRGTLLPILASVYILTCQKE